MGFIEEAEIMLENAESAKGGANKALRIGWLTLAKDTISAAITEAKKGVKAQDGHMPGQMSIDDQAKPRGRPRRTVKGDANGVVTTPADEAPVPGEPPDGEPVAAPQPSDPEDDAALTAKLGTDFDAWKAGLPTEEEFDAQQAQQELDADPSRLTQLDAHKQHWAANPGLYVEDCDYCAIVAAGGAEVEAHDRPDTTGDEIPRIGDSRPIPERATAE